jgi:hypothetical protein
MVKTKKGTYKPINSEKCKNPNLIVYRSSLELKFMIWCDKNTRVLEWGSENVVVPYVSPVDGKIHRYFVDMYVKIKEKDVVRKYLVEIKPARQTQPPKPSKRKKTSTVIYENATWQINLAKWEAAKQFAKKYNMDFIIITDQDLAKMYK